MPRDLPVGNGRLLVAFDKSYRLREFYFPHVGQDDHTKGVPFRFGVWVNGQFSWVPDGWAISMDYMNDTLVTDVELLNTNLGVRISANDLVDFHENIYMKRLRVENLTDRSLDVRLFFCHDFRIYGNDIGDTACYRPDARALLHYKDRRYFLINMYANKLYGIEHYTTGGRREGSPDGTWKDAEDGLLGSNPIAQGSVDSVAGAHLTLGPNEEDTLYYWISAGKDWKEVERLNRVVVKSSPQAVFKRTADYWRLWVDKEELNYDLLPESITRLYKRSLLIARTQIDNCGSIIAANDSDVVQFNRDTYSYMWPRDGALVAYGMDLAGYSEITRRFFNLAARIIESGGYFLHKYTPSGALASSWHPWLKGSEAQLPIQEDETALVIWALWKHYGIYRDIEFIKPLYKPLIKSAANMMMSYMDRSTGLPLPSYDLWEERRGILTFTSAAVWGGVTAAANFADAFGEKELAEEYMAGARSLRAAMDKYLYLEGEQRFARMVNFAPDGSVEVDATLDASLFGLFAFGAYSPSDPKVTSTMEQVYKKLWCVPGVGGLARYEGDPYHKTDDRVPGNPWFVTTLWYAQYLIAISTSDFELERAMEIIKWVAGRSLKSGVLAEQINPQTNEPLSVSPLTWSHGTFVTVVQEYINKKITLERCPTCSRSKYSKKREKLVHVR